MKKLSIILILFILVFITSCSNKPIKDNLNTLEDGEIFTSTQKYQILCWVIKKHENYTKNYYKCQAGKKTKGWGFTNVKNVRDIHHADEIFKGIIEELYIKVNKDYPTLTYLQKAVIVSLYYNTGDVTAIKNSNFIKFLVDNDIEKSIDSFQKWNKVKVIIKGRKRYIVSNGLVNRRSYEAKLLDGSFNMTDYDNLKKEMEKIYLKSKSV
jgi:GH24 family phage-related lysozyme (muramidase)